MTLSLPTPRMTPQRAMVIAVAYISLLALAVAAFWYTILVGGNPFTVREFVSINSSGSAQSVFRPGDLVGIRRVMCSTRNADAQFRMSIKSDLNMTIPLYGVVAHVPAGCRPHGYAFIMPQLPPGLYTVHSTVIYQTNLVGRDEYTEFDPITIEVRP